MRSLLLVDLVRFASPGLRRASLLAAFTVMLAACGDDDPAICETTALPSRDALRCESEWLAQAARPLDASLPGARTVKTIIDRAKGHARYYLDTEAYPLHSAFAVAHLNVPPGTSFVEQYLSPGRRFLLGSITHYEEPDIWAYELAPYDTSTAEMLEEAFAPLAAHAFFGDRLRFHPTSEAQVQLAAQLPASIPVVTTDEIYAGTSYQPLNLGETYAQVRIMTAAELATTYVGPRELVVLDAVPNDLTVVAGVITEAFQTPLSHVNVLSQQRGTPNMGLRRARTLLAPHAGRWVRLRVAAFEWTVAEVTADEADAWWEEHRPPPTIVPAPDYAVTGILDIDDVGVADVRAVGGKAANYGALRDLGEPVIVRDALAIPVVYYRDFLAQHGFDVAIAEMLADPDFRADGNVRRQRLAALQAEMRAAPIDPVFLALLEARLEADFPGTRMKFRSSTNAEDLEHHTGAGLYDSESGQVGDPSRPVADAVRVVWASAWNLRAFEERAAAGIDHTQVAMGVLINPSFRDEAANGVAITANVYDPAPGGEDAFYVNAQRGEASVVSPDPAVTADQLIYFFFHANQPATYLTRSSLAPVGTPVLTARELFDLGQQLAALREHFERIYEAPAGYARLPMDVEWKLVAEGGTTHIEIKQARPYPGRGQ